MSVPVIDDPDVINRTRLTIEVTDLFLHDKIAIHQDVAAGEMMCRCVIDEPLFCTQHDLPVVKELQERAALMHQPEFPRGGPGQRSSSL